MLEELESPTQAIDVGGKQYTVSRLTTYFEDLSDEDHPLVLLLGLDCILLLLGK